MALPQHFLDELRRRVSLAEIIGRSVKLTKKGRRYLGLCPFHQEKTPSFNVNDDEGFYHCFGCGVSGDAITFLREKDGMEFMEAVRHLAASAGMDVPHQAPVDPAEIDRRNKTLIVLDEATRQFQSAMLEGRNPALAYLEGRGVGRKVIEEFKLGFAPQKGLIETLNKFGHQTEHIIEAGLARISDRDQSLYPMFRGRLMFPITDNKGQVIAFGGRALGEGQEPKYLNSAESKLFHKKYTLYGMALARAELRKGKPLVVAEGYMDVIAIHQSGAAAAVAPLGTALTEEQIRLLWRMDERPILCFDGDAAGRSAALKALIRALPLLEAGKTLRLALMPAGVDPDDLIQAEGADAFSRLLDQSISMVDGLWNGISEQFQLTEAEGRAAFWKQIRSHVREINDPSMRVSISDEIQRRIKEMRDNFREAFGRPAPLGRGGGRVFASDRPKIDTKLRAKVILALLVEHPNLVDDFYDKIVLLQFNDEKMEKLRQKVIDIVSNQASLDIEEFRHHLTGVKAKMRFDPKTLSGDEARERLAEVIEVEINQNKRLKKKAYLQRSR